MLSDRNITKLLLTAAFLFPALACRAVTNLVRPPAPSPFPSAAAALPASTDSAGPEAAASCRNIMADVLETAQYGAEPNGLGSAQDSDTDPEHLVTYRVQGDQILDADLEIVPAEFVDEQQATEGHQRAWDYFTALIPAEERRMLSLYIIITDGPENILGGIAQADQPEQWALQIDIRDVDDVRDLSYTLLHEFGHLLTLNAQQVPPSQAVFDHPEDNELYEREAAACPEYFPGEGCSRPDSYINVFFNRFWTEVYPEWQAIDLEEDDDVYDRRLEEFYRRYRDRFVSDYAPTSPEEDIAESWAFFILSPKPDGDDIADRKLLFFYEYPELVRLRQELLANLCEALPIQ
jgi:hypothetical protein